ncbi:MAG: asparagine synthase [Rhodospirillales bacterium]|nr:asparagine synthase [Rhodospirillales bacterium]
MCGLSGIFDTTGARPIDPGILTAMNDSIAHRGPDGDGFLLEPGIGLGHRRLAIIDLAGGTQPLFNETGDVAVVFNGEIYNYRETMTELMALGHRFKTHSDTEVIVHGWEEWGPACLGRLRGMFAFALWDRRRQNLFMARDRLGKKPLYYSLLPDGQLVFASEMRALLCHPGVERRIDPTAVDGYFALGYVPEPGSIYQNIRKLPAAHSLTVERGKPMPEPSRYWTLRFDPRPMNEADAEVEFIERLRESTRLRLVSDVPLGAFLSGGVDSSAVVAMMASLTSDPVKTFAIGFGGSEDELGYAQRVADRYRTNHTAERSIVDYLDTIDEQAAIFGEPFADSSAIPTGRVSELARRGVTVALSGDAGDELFAGYRRYRFHMATQNLRSRIPDGIRQPLFSILGSLYPKLDRAPRWLRAKTTFQELSVDEFEGYYRTVCKIPDAARSGLFSPRLSSSLNGYRPANLIRAAMAAAGTDDPMARAQFADIQTYLIGDILTKVDRASMAHSLEARAPLLDHELVEWAATVPPTLKIRSTGGKYIMKKALEPYVPHENLYRTKQGFATSLAPQFRGIGAERVRSRLTGQVFRDSGLFDNAAISTLVDQHDSGAFDHNQAIWSLVMFDGWLKSVHAASVAVPLTRDAAARVVAAAI